MHPQSHVCPCNLCIKLKHQTGQISARDFANRNALVDNSPSQRDELQHRIIILSLFLPLFLSFCLSCGTQKTNRPWAVCVCVCVLPSPGRGNKLIQSRLKMRHGSAHKPHQVSFFWTAMSCWSSQRLLLNNKCLCAAVIPRNSFLSPPLLHFLLKEAPETFFP